MKVVIINFTYHPFTIDFHCKYLALSLSTYCAVLLRVERWESERAQGPMTSGEEADGVMEKLRVSSLRWHHIGTIGPVLSRGFEAYLTPFQFKEQIQKSFEVTLSKTEVYHCLLSTACYCPVTYYFYEGAASSNIEIIMIYFLFSIEITALIGRYKDDLLKGMYYIDGHKFLGHFKGALHQEAWVSHIEEQKKYGEHRDKVRSKFYTPCTLGDHLGR